MSAISDTHEYQTLRDALHDPDYQSVRVAGIFALTACARYRAAAHKLTGEGFAKMEFIGGDLVVTRRHYEQRFAINRPPNSDEVLAALSAVRTR